MKKMWLLVICVLLLTVLPANAGMSNMTYVSVFDENDGNINGMAYMDSMLVATTDKNKYFAIDPFSDYRKTVRTLPSEWTEDDDSSLSGQWGIIPGDDGLYIVSYYMTIDDDDIDDIEIRAVLRRLELSSGGKLEQDAEWELDFETVTDALGGYAINAFLTQACVTNGYLVGKIDDLNGSLLAVFDIEDEDCELIPSDVSLHGIYVDGNILTSEADYAASTIKFSAFDPASDEYEEIITVNADEYGSSGYTAYMSDTGTLFYVSDNMLCRITDMNAATAESICPVATGSGFMPISVAAGHDTYIVTDGALATVYDASVQVSGTTLSIHDEWSWSVYEEATAAKNSFMQIHPDVIITEAGDSDIIQSMMSRSDEVDIYILCSSNDAYDVLKQRGYLVPLNGIEGIEDTVNSMYPHIRDFISEDGSIYALPVDYAAFAQLEYSDLAMEELGFEHEDMPATWTDFFRFIAENQHILDENGVVSMFPLKYSIDEVRRSIFDTMVEDYMQYIYTLTGAVTFDTDVFRGLLAEFEKVDFAATGLTEEGDAPGWTGYNKDTLFWTNGGRLSPAAYCNPTELGGMYQLVLSPTEDSDTAVYAEIPLMVINPYSKHIDLALDFVAAVHDNASLETCTAMCPDLMETKLVATYEEDLAYFAGRVEQVRAEMEKASEEDRDEWEKLLEAAIESYESFLNREHKWCWEISESSIAWFRSFADRIAISTSCGMNREARSVIYEQLLQYYDGLISAEEMIMTIDSRIEMMRLEAQ